MSEQTSLAVSIIIPAYNEEARIRPTLEEYAAHFDRLYGKDFELLVVLNGCEDNTRGVVGEVGRCYPQVRVVEFLKPMGKGGAIWEGFALARGNRLVFVDADNMVRAPEAEKLLRALDTQDVAIADRFSGHEENGTGSQPLGRRIISWASRRWVHLYLDLPYSDTQCGAKAFRAAVWRRIAPDVLERGWAFDLDVLAQIRRHGFSVAQVPVRWRHIKEGTKVKAWKDVPKTFLATFRIRRRARRPL